MKKLINRPEDLVAEMLEGIAACYPGLARLEGWPVIVASDRQPDAPLVALISGGGSGHEPAHAGYVGAGMLTAAVAGAVSVRLLGWRVRIGFVCTVRVATLLV